jgi:Flp pilus assembly protein TadD
LEELYHKHPDDPFVITDHAFALWQLGRREEANALLDRLSLDDRLSPQRATFLAVIYGTTGRRREARTALTLVPAATSLLPEEAELIARAAAIALD